MSIYPVLINNGTGKLHKITAPVSGGFFSFGVGLSDPCIPILATGLNVQIVCYFYIIVC